MAAVDMTTRPTPAYDRALLTEELGRFDQCFLESLLGYAPSDSERELIARVGNLLIESALEQPKVLVHRDFHSRNLMLQDEGELAVIDFQDAVLGPVTYDLASLLKDCYISWPAEQVNQWVLQYRGECASLGSLAVTDAHFLRWFDWMGLQRHIKVLGTFARLYLRDGKSGYLEDLPLVIHYVEQTLRQYAGQEPVFAEFHDWFAGTLSPRIAQQSWSKKQ
jgi:aminoglycoside/choline kinase family phosphotransferase